MAEKFTKFDPADYLETSEDIAIYLGSALETGDANYIAKAFGVAARAKGMTEIAKAAGLSREQLYRSFSERGNPTLKTLLAVMKALGIQLAVKTQAGAKAKPHKVKKAA